MHSLLDVQQTTDVPASKKAPRPRKPKTDEAMTQPAPIAVRDKSGRFVKKEGMLPVSEQRSVPAPVPAKGAQSAPTSAVAPKTAEPGATARCQDGTFSHRKQHSGSCSRHGGVAQWLAE